MDYELELTKANRLKVAHAFRLNKRVDLAIDCAVEGQLGRVLVDDLAQPTVYCLRVGPFGYFAGDAHSAAGRHLMAGFSPYHLLMPSPPAWIEVAQEIFGDALQLVARFSFSSEQLSPEHLARLLARSKFWERVVPIDAQLSTQAAGQPDSMLDLADFDSAADFVQRGFGYTVLDNGKMMGVAYSSLVCSCGIEVSVYVDEAYRQRGVATALCCRLLLDCLSSGLRPNWDAANRESVRLAEKLGYHFRETYNAYYHTSSDALQV